MKADILLSLIHDLYAQVLQLKSENEKLKKELKDASIQ